ncbi:hypothetical protein PHET_00713 [Paragonimus heterotremus]|uniref:Uncharacterized protein n=1 Tax=Paragonimus heterotremus TaxID=100268 RepID=A0A8J4TIE3_9TREM|nr:hypothetical protein PHET_00713 [Paragonimus heterotremus]
MIVKQRRPLFWICLTVSSFGLICFVLSFVLPFWYAKFPQSKNRFTSLGLWEVCFKEFMPESIGNLMYTGCFYLYDPQVKPLWSSIFRTWFVVCQVFHTFSLLTFILAEVVLVTQAFNLISPRGPRAVLFVMVTCSLTCLFLLVELITMGVGVDSEAKRKPSEERDWLQALDQCSLSWSYGLAAMSFPGNFLIVVILGWFVYPKRSTGGLLSICAWDWPTVNDWTCRYHQTDMHLSTSASRSQSCRSRSVGSVDNRTQSATSDHVLRPVLTFREPLISVNPSTPTQRITTPSALRSAQTHHSHITSSVSDSFAPAGKLSCYDPRSPDTVSLLSYEQPPLMLPVHSPSTVGEQSSIHTQDVNTKSFNSSSRSHHNVPAHESHSRLHQAFGPQRFGVGTGTPDGESEHVLVSGRQSKLQSSESSMWTADSSIQVARPMRKGRGPKGINPKNLSKHVISTASIEEVDELPPENVQPHVQVQTAKRMIRRS